jgi:hypothetical protein
MRERGAAKKPGVIRPFYRLTHDFSGSLALQEILTQETTASRSVFRTDSTLLTRERTTQGDQERGWEIFERLFSPQLFHSPPI